MRDKQGKQLTTSEVVGKGLNRVSAILKEFEIMLLRWAGHIPSHTIRRVLYRLAGVKFGKGSTIHMWCQFFEPKNITIGQDSIIGDHAFLDGRAKLSIGSHVMTASGVKIYNSQHDIDDEHFTPILGDVIIKDYAFIGANSVILPGVTIHEGGVVASGAIVTRDVPAFTLVGGVPAREIRKRRLLTLQYKLGRASWFR